MDMSVLLKPHANITTGQSTARFYLADCIEVFRQLPARSVDVIVTSPPYNLGIQYNRYEDTLSATAYLEWTNAWVTAAARVLRPDGSLFLNVGAKPSDPWTALDVAQTVRSQLRLQNIIHWVKSIAIDRGSAGAAAGLTKDLAVGHYKPINSDRFLNDCH
jgi:site-specific DNA-methyltransferase (adenine-specific)